MLRIAVVALLLIAITAAIVHQVMALPAHVQATDNADWPPLLSLVGLVLGALLEPYIGRASDRLTGSERRMLLVWGGTAIAVLSLVFLPFTLQTGLQGIGFGLELGKLVAALPWLIFLLGAGIGLSCARTPGVAGVNDAIPVYQRLSFSGALHTALGLGLLVGLLLIEFFATEETLPWWLSAGLVVLGALFFWFVRQPVEAGAGDYLADRDARFWLIATGSCLWAAITVLLARHEQLAEGRMWIFALVLAASCWPLARLATPAAPRTVVTVTLPLALPLFVMAGLWTMGAWGWVWLLLIAAIGGLAISSLLPALWETAPPRNSGYPTGLYFAGGTLGALFAAPLLSTISAVLAPHARLPDLLPALLILAAWLSMRQIGSPERRELYTAQDA